jgi:hypothetical protein
LLPVIFQTLNVTFDCVSRATHGLVDSFTLAKATRQRRDFNPITAFLGAMDDHRVLHITPPLQKVQELAIGQTGFTNCGFEQTDLQFPMAWNRDQLSAWHFDVYMIAFAVPTDSAGLNKSSDRFVSGYSS